MDATGQSVTSPTNTAYKQAGTLQLGVPIGDFKLSYKGQGFCTKASSVEAGFYVILTSDNVGWTETNPKLKTMGSSADGTSDTKYFRSELYAEDNITLTEKSTFYLAMKSKVASPGTLSIEGLGTTVIKAECTL